MWESGTQREATRASEKVDRTGFNKDFCSDLFTCNISSGFLTSMNLLTSPMVQIMEVRVVKISTALARVLTVNRSASQKMR